MDEVNDLNKCKLGELITQRREKNPGGDLPICGVTREGFIPPKQQDADTSIYNIFYMNDFVFNPARMELNSIVFNDKYEAAICSSLYEIFYVSRTDLILPAYLGLWVKRDIFTRYCKFLGSGSAREYCRVANISEMEIEFPSLEEQQRIVEQNRVIKERINVLKKINDNLEESARAIYKKMFIEDIDNEHLPIGWEKLALGEVAILSAGGDRPSIFSDCPTAECSIPIYSNGLDNEGLYGYTNTAKISEESVTVSARGTVGYVFLREKPYVPIVRLISVIPNDNRISAKYLYFALNDNQTHSTGTSQQQITVPDYKKTLVIIPTKAVMAVFINRVSPLFASISENKNEIEQLFVLQRNLLTLLSR